MNYIKKLIVPCLLIGASLMNAMEAPPQKPAAEQKETFQFEQLPRDVQFMILERIIPNSSSIQEAIASITALLSTNQRYVSLLRNEEFTLKLIRALATKWTKGDELKAALYLGTAPAQNIVRKSITRQASLGHAYRLFAQAIIQSDTHIIKTLTALRLNLDNPGEEGNTLLIIASGLGNLRAVQYLLEHGASINLANNQRITPLATAIIQGKDDVAFFLLERNANVDTIDVSGTTPLLHLLKKKNCNIKLFNKLKQANANVLFTGPQRINALLLATEAQCVEIVAELLKTPNINVNHADNTGATALSIAASAGNLPIVEQLIAARANVNARTNSGNTPLMIASNKGHSNVVSQLLSAGANVNAKNNQNETALMTAAAGAQPSAMQQLIAAGAEINATNNAGSSPLIIAAQQGNKDVFEILLKAGAILNHKNTAGLNALMIATGKNNIPGVRGLLELGVNPNEVNNAGHSALLVAANKGFLEMVQLLLRHGANPNYQIPNNGLTPLIGAVVVETGNLANKRAIVRALLDNKANPNVLVNFNESDQNMTPLLLVSTQENPDPLLIQMLIDAGADTNHFGTFLIPTGIVRYSPLMIAAIHGDVPVVKILLDAGANPKLKDKTGRTAYQLARGLSSISDRDTREEQEMAKGRKNVVKFFESRGIKE